MAIWPTSVATNADLYVAVNALQTTLASSINNVVNIIPLTSTTNFPTAGAVTIGNEVIFYTGVAGATLTGATRGADGTTSAPHNSGVPVGATVVATHHNTLKDEIIALEGSLNLAANFALLSSGSGRVAVSTVSATELSYLVGVSSAIQTQLNLKATDSLVVHLSGIETVTGNKTFTGSTILADPVVDVRQYATINAAITAIGSTKKTLLVATAQTLAANLTIPSTMTLWITNTGSIVKASTFTVTINGQLIADRYQIFSGFSAGDVTGLNVAFPEWFGTTTAAFQSACDSLIIGGEVSIMQAKTYTLTSQVTINVNRISIVGLGFESNINYTPTANNTHAFGTPGTLDNVWFKNFAVHCTNPGSFTGTSCFFSAASDSAMNWDGVNISNFNRYGINPSAGVEYVTVRNCRFLQIRDTSSTALATALKFDGNNVVRVENNQFSECDKDISHLGGSVYFQKGNAHESGNDSGNTLADETVVLSGVKDFEISNEYYEGNVTASTYAVIDMINCVAGEIHSNLLVGQEPGNIDVSHILIAVSGASTRGIHIHNNSFNEVIDYFISSTVTGVTAQENYYLDGGAEKTTVAAIQALFNNPANIRLIQTISGTVHDTGTISIEGQLIAKGTATNDSAATGYIGEYIESVVGSTSMPATGVYGEITSITLTAGDWDLNGTISFEINGATYTRTDLEGLIGTASGNNITGGVQGSSYFIIDHTSGDLTWSFYAMAIPGLRKSIFSTTTYYLKVYPGSYSAGTPKARGRISARRVR